MNEKILNYLTEVYLKTLAENFTLNSISIDENLLADIKKTYQDGLRTGFVYGACDSTRKELKDEVISDLQHNESWRPA